MQSSGKSGNSRAGQFKNLIVSRSSMKPESFDLEPVSSIMRALRSHIHNICTEHIGNHNQITALFLIRADLDQQKLSVYAFIGFEHFDVNYIHQLFQLLCDLFKNQIVPVTDNGHSGISRICRRTYCKTVNVIASAAEHSRHTAQHSGCIINQ